jgi:hypothetical protein
MSGISGKYRFDARLGGGGMAEVFLGSTVGIEGFSRKVAIKRVLPGFSDNPTFAQMFVAEAQISSRLVHPNIVSVLDFDRDAEGRLFLVMELVEGRDMDALVSTGPVPAPLVIFLISEVLRGLGYAHDLPVGNEVRGVVHRDVSPHNVLLSWEGAVKVSDFGIAKARAASEATASVFIKGKPAYMSPEQANGQPLDGRSDLFAVGVMLWEMLVGRRLFVGEDTRATLAAVLFGQIPRPRSLRPDIPKDLERIVMKLLERDMPARYSSGEAAVADLLDCADAPKDGRALLVKTLAERFPNDAPMRQSKVRTPTPVHLQPTIAAPGDGRASMPSMGALRGAETGTMQPIAGTTPTGAAQMMGAATMPGSRRRRGNAKGIVLAVTGFVVAAAGAFGIVSVVTSGSKTQHSGAGSGSGSDTGSVAVVVADAASRPDAAPEIASVTKPTLIDAGVPDAATTVATGAKKDASSSQPAHPVAEHRLGKLSVLAFPILTVTVDRKNFGDTPITLPLPAGKHTVRLSNAETGHDETVVVLITENQTYTLDRRK